MIMSFLRKFFLLFAFLIFFFQITLPAAFRDAFVFAQLKYDGEWDPYPSIWREILSFLTTTTSIKAAGERKTVSVHNDMFSYPFIWIFGRNTFPELTSNEISLLRKFIDRGGMIFIDDSSDLPDSNFRKKIKNEFSKVFPEKVWQKIPMSHAMFRSFYLLRGVAGRKIWKDYLEGIALGDRFVVVFSANDIAGSWYKDVFGNYLHECIPGQEKQRWETQKLVINIIMYSLTGTYKSDAVHQPFIDRKLGR